MLSWRLLYTHARPNAQAAMPALKSRKPLRVPSKPRGVCKGLMGFCHSDNRKRGVASEDLQAINPIQQARQSSKKYVLPSTMQPALSAEQHLANACLLWLGCPPLRRRLLLGPRLADGRCRRTLMHVLAGRLVCRIIDSLGLGTVAWTHPWHP